jgi:hypothetical protein
MSPVGHASADLMHNAYASWVMYCMRRAMGFAKLSIYFYIFCFYFQLELLALLCCVDTSDNPFLDTDLGS